MAKTCDCWEGVRIAADCQAIDAPMGSLGRFYSKAQGLEQ
jgi:hypothetical protein